MKRKITYAQINLSIGLIFVALCIYQHSNAAEDFKDCLTIFEQKGFSIWTMSWPREDQLSLMIRAENGMNSPIISIEGHMVRTDLERDIRSRSLINARNNGAEYLLISFSKQNLHPFFSVYATMEDLSNSSHFMGIHRIPVLITIEKWLKRCGT